jgi:hypothetical protein
VNRVLQNLRAENLIQFQHGHLQILDIVRLRTLAGFEDGYLRS